MSTKNKSEFQEPGSDNESEGSSGPSGLGTSLKNRRMEKGISIHQLAQMTKLRMHFIEALENEDWDKLPAMVFVKGFIRSYAQAVDMDAEHLLTIYRQITPQQEEIPRPLVVPKSKTRKGIYGGIIAIGIIVFLIYYFWTDIRTVTTIPDSMNTANTSPTVDDVETPKPAPLDHISAQEPKEPPQWQGDLRLVQDDESAPAGSTQQELVLKAFVNMRTWVEIHIDDQPSKDYIFNPGDRYEWKAQQGFDILVGNAAGIEFDFNGEKIENLGEPAKVVRVRLPENFRSLIREE
ncbi:MAG: helix-turn-helix domain-containing protein [Deltaproteobacteria bacterium]|nr:helix-turn-helix domain-containing protein [Deltaproteobacteria bacterium]